MSKEPSGGILVRHSKTNCVVIVLYYESNMRKSLLIKRLHKVLNFVLIPENENDRHLGDIIARNTDSPILNIPDVFMVDNRLVCVLYIL